MSRPRGRIGGYGRTGRFLQIAEFNKWYDINLIKKRLNDSGDDAKYSNAKTVFESLDRGKCHLTKRRRKEKRSQIMLLEPVSKAYSVPGELIDACPTSIKEYLTGFLLTNGMGTKMDVIRREYHKDDRNLLEIAKQQRDKIAINFNDSYYSIAGWEMVNDIVHILFKAVKPTQLRVGLEGQVYFS